MIRMNLTTPLLLGIVLLMPGWKCQNVSGYNPTQPTFRRRIARLSTRPSLAEDRTEGVVSTTGINAREAVIPTYWNFQGHPCYAEIACPDFTAMRPKTYSEAAGRFFFGGERADVIQSIKGNNPMAALASNRKSNRPDIVLIHGFGCSTTYWRETRTTLTKAGYTVHALDLLGQGKSAKPGRADNIEYSIDLWAKMVEEYTEQFIPSQHRVVLIGNSLGSVVALSAATGDHMRATEAATLPPRIQGIGMFNCGIGMNSRNLLKDPSLSNIQRILFTFLFDALDKLLFSNIPLLTYVLEAVVTKDLLRNALLTLYRCSPAPEQRVDDALVDSFYYPAKDKGSPEALSQIYTNDAGKTPMEFHQQYADFLDKIPFHIVWGTDDKVTPIDGPVGRFYLDLVKHPNGRPISLSLVEGGHVPFDEIPDCNGFVLQWLEDVVLACKANDEEPPGGSTKGLFKWPFASK